MLQPQKELIIVGGANGSGKTTFAKPYVEELGYRFLNADEIAKELQLQGEQNALIKVGRIFFTKLREYIDQGQNFVVETTLSGSYINKVARRALEKGYQLGLVYVFLDNPKLCVERVRIRVKKGGHDVPEEAIIRRYYRSKSNFWNNFIKLANDWILLYNGEEGFQHVALGKKQEYSIENHILFSQFVSIPDERG
ncbi:MAG: AAA family ATPase [Bacteroidota bacterium]